MSAFRDYVGRQVMVQIDENAIAGRLTAEKGDVLAIADPSLCIPGRDPQTMDGEVLIHVGRLDWVQVV